MSQRENDSEQNKVFQAVARALGCDEDEARWEATLRTIARQKPKEPSEREPATAEGDRLPPSSKDGDG